jgi:hypothetical protein
MIATQYIPSTTSKPVKLEGFEPINILKWSNSKWKSLCPYYLKTDGNETCSNPGGVLFENFYQGCKLYDVVYENEVYPSRFHHKPQYLWWKFVPETSTGDVLWKEEEDDFNHELYFRWRDQLWNCPNPIRYPNKIHRRKDTRFSLSIDANGNEIRMDYITSRKEIYLKEYLRLVRALPEYHVLLSKLNMICEIDVPANHKHGSFGLGSGPEPRLDENNICMMNIEKLETLINDPIRTWIVFGLCIANGFYLSLRILQFANSSTKSTVVSRSSTSMVSASCVGKNMSNLDQ